MYAMCLSEDGYESSLFFRVGLPEDQGESSRYFRSGPREDLLRMYFIRVDDYLNTRPTGQWSLPRMSVCMFASSILSHRRLEAMK